VPAGSRHTGRLRVSLEGERFACIALNDGVNEIGGLRVSVSAAFFHPDAVFQVTDARITLAGEPAIAGQPLRAVVRELDGPGPAGPDRPAPASRLLEEPAGFHHTRAESEKPFVVPPGEATVATYLVSSVRVNALLVYAPPASTALPAGCALEWPL
jgi:hypothetical protein